MPLFYFDFFDGRKSFKDEEGSSFQTLDQACEEAFAYLKECCVHRPNRDHTGELTVTMRDQAGSDVYRITMVLRGERLR